MLYYETYRLSPRHPWVVFIHGLGGSSTIWYKQIEEYKRHFNLVFIDLHGHGKTIKKLCDIRTPSFKRIADDVLDVLDHLKIKSAHFVGISLGTIIINSIATFAPNRIKSMVLGGAVTRLNLRSKVLMSLGDFIKGITPYMWLYKLFAWIIMPKGHHSKSREIFSREAKKLGDREFYIWYKISKGLGDVYQRLRTIKKAIPKLYILGIEDYMFLPIIREDSSQDKYARLHVIEDCGHVCNIEKPEEFNNVSIKFINEIINKTKDVLSLEKDKNYSAV